MRKGAAFVGLTAICVFAGGCGSGATQQDKDFDSSLARAAAQNKGEQPKKGMARSMPGVAAPPGMGPGGRMQSAPPAATTTG